jgi:hypothetical protein
MRVKQLVLKLCPGLVCSNFGDQKLWSIRLEDSGNALAASNESEEDAWLEMLIRLLRCATEEELREQGRSLARSYKPGPRQASPFPPVSPSGRLGVYKPKRRTYETSDIKELHQAIINKIALTQIAASGVSESDCLEWIKQQLEAV